MSSLLIMISSMGVIDFYMSEIQQCGVYWYTAQVYNGQMTVDGVTLA